MKQHYLEGVQLGRGESASFLDTTAQSFVESTMWHVIAGGITFLTLLCFSRSISTTLSVVGSDFVSKSVTTFVGKRIMNNSQAGRKKGANDIGQSLAKVLIWGLFAIFNMLIMSFLIAKKLSLASKNAGLDATFKTVLMFAYERVWAKIEWGIEYLLIGNKNIHTYEYFLKYEIQDLTLNAHISPNNSPIYMFPSRGMVVYELAMNCAL
jgi:hypothetical protein